MGCGASTVTASPTVLIETASTKAVRADDSGNAQGTIMGIDGPEPADLVQVGQPNSSEALPASLEEASEAASALTDSETVSGSAVPTVGEGEATAHVIEAVVAVHAGDFSVGVSAQASRDFDDAQAPVAEVVAAVVAEALVAAAVDAVIEASTEVDVAQDDVATEAAVANDA